MAYKVILIDDDEEYLHLIKKFCEDLQNSHRVVFFEPSSKDEFDELREVFTVALEDGLVENFKKEARIDLQLALEKYAGNDKEVKVLYLIDYELFDGKHPEVNGVDLYKNFIKTGAVIFMTDPSDCEDGRFEISKFCKENPNSAHVDKDDNFESMLKLVMKRFFALRGTLKMG